MPAIAAFRVPYPGLNGSLRSSAHGPFRVGSRFCAVQLDDNPPSQIWLGSFRRPNKKEALSGQGQRSGEGEQSPRHLGRHLDIQFIGHGSEISSFVDRRLGLPSRCRSVSVGIRPMILATIVTIKCNYTDRKANKKPESGDTSGQTRALSRTVRNCSTPILIRAEEI